MALKNQGFSLVSVMVAAGLGLIVMTAVTQQFVNQIRMTHYLEAKMEANQFKHELTLMLEKK
ncbi:MAG: prepilin-type N-terminal cleavage/methylation domain-containing protein [Pseudomonadota bacterium]|nr:prepilin-type N-terminal cleavage/methylation domain-containing protein [Pseudomonadota bacterium]